MVVSWLYFLGNDKNPTELFLYGLSLFTQFDEAINLSPEEIGKTQSDLLGIKKIYLFKSVKNLNFSDIIDGNKIKLTSINSNLSYDLEFNSFEKTIRNPKHFDYNVPESPVSTTIELTTYYVEQIKSLIDDPSEKNTIIDILKVLQKDTGLKFLKGYSRSFGCYELALDLPEWAESEQPFDLSIKEKVLTFERNNHEAPISLHVIIYKNKEIIFDKMLMLSEGEKTYSFPQCELDDLEYWVFDKDGNLLHHEYIGLIKQISVRMHAIGNTVKITDKSRSISVPLIRTSLINVCAPRKASDIEQSYRIQTMHNLIKADCDSQTNQKFFTKSKNSLNDVIAYINTFIGDEPSEVYFIDPFITISSLLPICGINKTTTKITLISAWKNFDPDEENPNNTDIETLMTKTINAIENISKLGLPVSRLIWFNLKKEVIHDRFIYIKNKDNYTILSISNSLNNLLVKYNFSILEFGGREKISVQKYLEEIISKTNSINQVYPKT